MKSSVTANKILLKRRSLSTNIDKEQKQNRSDLSHSADVYRTNVFSYQTPFRPVYSSRQNGPTRAKTTASQPKATISQRGITKILSHNEYDKRKNISDVLQPIPPPVAPRTTVPLTSRKEQPPIPIERKSINQSNTIKESDFSEEQLTTFTPMKEPEKLILPKIKNTNPISTIQHITPSTPHTPGLCGLINIGNTCFMNSALQCLSNIPELTQWAQDQKLSPVIRTKDVAHVYASLIQSMWSGENASINPREIKEIVSRSAPIFADYGQKDSHEFMNSLLNALERTNSKLIITDLFHIYTQSQVTCTGCHFIDTTDEITTFLPLPLPRETLNNKELLLEDLIHDYCLEDNLDGSYYCHACNSYTQAKQKTNISLPLPRVLIIQLKRFAFDGTDQKIDTFVRYKLQHSNLISNNDVYQLCAVSSHVGSLAGGHYTTLARNNVMKQWYRFNDSRIDKIDSDSIVTCNAYVLVYLKSE